VRQIAVLRADSDCPGGYVREGEVYVCDGGNRQDGVQFFSTHHSPEPLHVPPVIPEAGKSLALVVIRETMPGYGCGDGKGGGVLAENDEVHLPTTVRPPVTQVGDDPLSAASPAHLVDINAYFHGI
jgi:hypothetical protein